MPNKKGQEQVAESATADKKTNSPKQAENQEPAKHDGNTKDEAKKHKQIKD